MQPQRRLNLRVQRCTVPLRQRHDGHAARLARGDKAFDRSDLFPHDLFIEKNERAQRLTLSTDGDLPIKRKVVQVHSQFCSSEQTRTLSVVEACEAPQPADISLLCPDRIVLQPDLCDQVVLDIANRTFSRLDASRG